MSEAKSNGRRQLGLRASCSIAALLIGAGAPAWAACTSVGAYDNTTSVSGLCVTNTSFTGNINNSGTISSSGIKLTNGTITGNIYSSGTIIGGISLDAASQITSNNTAAIYITGQTFTGGISNAGTISAGRNGILVSGGFNSVSTFSGGISNSGTISVGADGIFVDSVSTFTGNISDSGTISAATGIHIVGSTINGSILDSGTILASNHGILIDSASKITSAATAIEVTGPTFTGGISNAGTISAGADGIFVENVSTFAGGISNSGKITSSSNDGIYVAGVSTFAGGISNSGTISAQGIFGYGIFIDGVTNFSGGISNSGTISVVFPGIVVATVSSFSGGISNSGMILVAGGVAGIGVIGVTSFSGGISNSGTITSAGWMGIQIGRTNVSSYGVSTFSGNISNSGTISDAIGIGIGSNVTFAAGGAIINSGTISGSVAAIDASYATSPVTIDQTGGLISGAIKLSAYADVLNISGGTIAGNIIGQGSSDTLNFALGSGSFTYGSAYGFSGINQVNINSGMVVLDGTNSATNVTVNGGTLQVGDASNTGATLTATNGVDVYGTLAGHGTITGNVSVENGGTLSPGGSIGTLTINGNLMLSSGSFYDVEISPTQSSKTQVNGTATLNGATVVANLTTSQLGLYYGNSYTILSASNALSANNKFNPAVTVVASGLTSAEQLTIESGSHLSYDSNDALLSLALPSYAVTLALPSNAPLNAQNAAEAINNFVLAGGTLPAGFQNLANLSGQALNNAANQLAGQSQGSFAPVGFTAGSQFLNLMLNPYIEGRSGFANGGAPAGAAPLAYADEPAAPPAASAFSALALGPRTFDPHMSFWASAYGGSGSISGNAATGAANTNSQIYGFATGVDYQAMPNTIFGLALGGGGTSWQLGEGMGSGHSGMFQAGLYGTTHIGAAYISGAAAYSLQDVTTNRTVTLAGSDMLQGNFAANVLSARIESGYRLAYGPIAVTPYGAVQTQAMFLPSYAEYAVSGSSQFALTYTNHTYNATRTELGAWFDTDSLAAFGLPWTAQGLKLYSRLAWAHDFDNEGTSTAFFQSLPGGGTFLVNSAKPANDGALVTAGFEYKLADGWSVLANFDSEFSSTTAIFSGTGTLRKVW